MTSSYSKDIENAVHDGTDSMGSPTEDVNAVALHDGTEQGKKDFLASFTAAEDKAIMRKVDWRFLWLIGITYLIKNSEWSQALRLRINLPILKLTFYQS